MTTTQLRSLLDREVEAGVYLFESEVGLSTIADEVRRAGYNFYYIDGREISTERSFFGETQRALNFPSYFGHNWDAFDECITDLSWLPTANGNVILYDYFDKFAESDPENFRLAYYGLAYATRQNTGPRCCYVLLRGDENLLPETPSKMKG